jgi:dTDP-glucose pyrophosphorylase
MKQHWEQILIRSDATLKTTIEVIDRAALQIALVVDENNRLIGVVTDGDIRRALIRGLGLDTAVSEVMNKRPKIAAVHDTKSQMLAIMEGHHLYQLPVVDDDGRVVRLESLQALYKQPTFPNPVFLLAGGFGTRLRPLTDDCPKPLLEIGGKPILETILENFIKAGFRNFYIAVHYRAQQIKDYFGNGERWAVTIHYIEEQEPMGTAGAIGLLPDDLPDVPLIVMNGDILTQIDFSRLLAYHNEQQAIATLCVRQYEYQIPYGVVNLDQHRVIGIEEKPLQYCLTNAGIYVLDHSLIKSIARQKKLDMPSLLNLQVAEGEPVAMFPIQDYWLDIGLEADFLRAQGDFQHVFLN